MKEAPADTWQLNVYYEGIEKDAWLHNWIAPSAHVVKSLFVRPEEVFMVMLI
jgi:hypothetical protein